MEILLCRPSLSFSWILQKSGRAKVMKRAFNDQASLASFFIKQAIVFKI
jgi:hypothetical protein